MAIPQMLIKMLSTARTRPRVPSIIPKSFFAFWTPSFSMICPSIGTNAWDAAPSPKKRRKVLGILKASTHALIIAPPPITLARSISLKRPSIRLINTAAEAEAPFLIICRDIFYLKTFCNFNFYSRDEALPCFTVINIFQRTMLVKDHLKGAYTLNDMHCYMPDIYSM